MERPPCGSRRPSTDCMHWQSPDLKGNCKVSLDEMKTTPEPSSFCWSKVCSPRQLTVCSLFWHLIWFYFFPQFQSQGSHLEAVPGHHKKSKLLGNFRSSPFARLTLVLHELRQIEKTLLEGRNCGSVKHAQVTLGLGCVRFPTHRLAHAIYPQCFSPFATLFLWTILLLGSVKYQNEIRCISVKVTQASCHTNNSSLGYHTYLSQKKKKWKAKTNFFF